MEMGQCGTINGTNDRLMPPANCHQVKCVNNVNIIENYVTLFSQFDIPFNYY